MAGEIKTPNAFQKLIHRFLANRAVSAFFAPRAYRMDKAVLQFTRGKHALAVILGWPIVQITTLGAKTNQPRAMPLVGVIDHEK